MAEFDSTRPPDCKQMKKPGRATDWTDLRRFFKPPTKAKEEKGHGMTTDVTDRHGSEKTWAESSDNSGAE